MHLYIHVRTVAPTNCTCVCMHPHQSLTVLRVCVVIVCMSACPSIPHAATIRSCSSLTQMWFREFFLELTMGERIQVRLPNSGASLMIISPRVGTACTGSWSSAVLCCLLLCPYIPSPPSPPPPLHSLAPTPRLGSSRLTCRCHGF